MTYQEKTIRSIDMHNQWVQDIFLQKAGYWSPRMFESEGTRCARESAEREQWEKNWKEDEEN